jgi:hypothetical protein
MSIRKTNRTITLGLISDTHMPDRWRTLHDSLFDIFAGVDLILHAGDVGELWVLDQLSQVAPVVAVHGNDDSPDSIRELPFQQVVVIGGRRILLTHSHFPDRDEEMEKRKIDEWHPKLQRLADMAKGAGADILVFGHTHIALDTYYDGVRLINPGAIASGSHFNRQTIQTVAQLIFSSQTEPVLRYFDVNQPDRVFAPQVDLEAGFRAALEPTQEVIITDDLSEESTRLMREIYPLAPAPLIGALSRVAHRCWSGEQDKYSLQEVIDEVMQADDVPPAVKQKIRDFLPSRV